MAEKKGAIMTLVRRDAPGRLLLKPKEAAAMLSIGQTRLYKLIQAGEIPVVKMPAIRIAVSDLQRWVEDHKS